MLTAWRAGTSLAMAVAALAGPIRAEVTVDDTATFQTSASTITTNALPGFDPIGSEKLVATFSYENNAAISSVSYDGMPMTLAVTGDGGGGKWTHIYYLDTPGGPGDLVVSPGIGQMGGSLLALSGTRDGIATVNAHAGKSVTLRSISTDMFVVASHINNGALSSAAQPPLTGLFDGDTGSSWGASGHRSVPTTGTRTTNVFTGSSAGAATIAAGFEADANPGTMGWFDVSVSSITSNAATLSALLAGTNADVTVYWEAGTVTDPATHAGWDGTNGPSAAATGIVERVASGLSPDTSYTYAFYGSGGGQEVWSYGPTFITAFSDNQAPVLTGVNQAEHRLAVNLTWDDRANYETAYILQRSTNDVSYSTVATLDPNTLSYTDAVPSIGAYSYRLVATNSANGTSTDATLCETSITVSAPAFGVIQTLQVTDALGGTIIQPFKVDQPGGVLVVGIYRDGTVFNNIRFGDGGGVDAGDQAADGVVTVDRGALAYFLNPSTEDGLAIRVDSGANGFVAAWVLAGVDLAGTVNSSQTDTITAAEDSMYIVSWAYANSYGEPVVLPAGNSDIDSSVDITFRYAGAGTGSGTGGSSLAPIAGTYRVGWIYDGNGSPLSFAFPKYVPAGAVFIVK